MKIGSKIAVALVAPGLVLGAASSFSPAPWGRDGHLTVGREAALHLPESMPRFFRGRTDRLSYLNYEPDRWRSDELRKMDDAFKYDHYIDLENVPSGALAEPNRFQYLLALEEAGLENPVRDGGFLPYRIAEVYERLLTGFRRWRAAEEPERGWIEERILNDAGILGHYVADGAQPHHTTIHFNGWARGVPNPQGYTRSDDFHWSFESAFVSAHVPEAEVARRVSRSPRLMDDVWHDVLQYIGETHRQVETLYRLERDVGFDPEAPADSAAVAFTAERLAAGAEMLRDLWWTAWVTSEEMEPR